MEQKETGEDITNRNVDLEKALVSLEITVDRKHINPHDKSRYDETKKCKNKQGKRNLTLNVSWQI